MKASEYQDIGQYLHDSRESLRIPLADAARALHIREKYLVAIESGQLDGLPGKAYIRGYIRNYVEFLRLDAAEVLEAYENLLAHKGQEFFIPEATLKENLPSFSQLMAALAGLVLIYGYWYFGVHDRTELARFTADPPEKFLQVLDKNDGAAMDKAWQTCLEEGDPECFRALALKAAAPLTRVLYEPEPADDETQEP